MKYVLVGDIHGKVECVEEALAKDGKKIFVGDFMDSFDRSALDMGKCLDLVISAIEKGEAEAIYGNHELSYLIYYHRCSGYSEKNHEIFRGYKKKIEDLFIPFSIIGENVLVTHAGLTRQIWEEYSLDMKSLGETLQTWWDTQPKNMIYGGFECTPAHWIGRSRGGNQSVGGIFWNDFNREFQPIPGLTQVFGHTAGNGIRRVEDSYCIDCLDREHSFLEIEI